MRGPCGGCKWELSTQQRKKQKRKGRLRCESHFIEIPRRGRRRTSRFTPRCRSPRATRGNGPTIRTLRTRGGLGLGGQMMRSPQGGLSAGKGRSNYVMWPRWGKVTPQVDILRPKSYCGAGFPHCRYVVSAWMHLAHGEGRCPPLCGPVDPIQGMKQGKSGGSIGTTCRGKGRVCREVRISQVGRGRVQRGERQMGTASYRGKGCKERARVSGERPIGTSSFRQ